MRGVPSAESDSVPDSCVAEEELGRVDDAAFGVAWELLLDSTASSSPSESSDEGRRGRDFKGIAGSVLSWNICSWNKRVSVSHASGRLHEREKHTRLSIRSDNVCHQVLISLFSTLFTSSVSGSTGTVDCDETDGVSGVCFAFSNT